MPTWYCGFDDTLRVSFNSAALRVFHANQQHRVWYGERGGVLFAATVGAEDGRVEVMNASPPHSRDQSARYSLRLDPKRVQQDIDSAYAQGLHFVGYWHTHPQSVPRLSEQDISTILPVMNSAGLDLARVLMVVVGVGRNEAPIDVCAVTKASSQVERLIMHNVTVGGTAPEEWTR